jgi:hypothetical protein
VSDRNAHGKAGGPDAESLPYLVFQTVLAVVTGSAFTATGAEWLEHFLTKFGIDRPRVKQWRMLFLLGSLVVVIVLWTQMQAIASVYDRFHGSAGCALTQVAANSNRYFIRRLSFKIA